MSGLCCWDVCGRGPQSCPEKGAWPGDLHELPGLASALPSRSSELMVPGLRPPRRASQTGLLREQRDSPGLGGWDFIISVHTRIPLLLCARARDLRSVFGERRLWAPQKCCTAAKIASSRSRCPQLCPAVPNNSVRTVLMSAGEKLLKTCHHPKVPVTAPFLLLG